MNGFFYGYKFKVLMAAVAIFMLGVVVLPDIMYNSAMKVDVIKAKKESVEIIQSGVGKIVSADEKTVISDYDLVIKKVLVKDGEYVKKGDKIIEVDVEATKGYYLSEQDFETADKIKRYITAEKDGYISKLGVKSNINLPSGTEMFTLIPTDSLKAVTSIGESKLRDLKAGQKVRISGTAFSGEYDGVIDSIGAYAETSADGSSGVNTVVAINNADRRLKSGYTVNLKIVVENIDDAVSLPESAVSQDNNDEYVYVYKNGSAQKKSVKTKSYSMGKVILLSGIDEGESVIKNAGSLKGESVNVIANVKSEEK